MPQYQTDLSGGKVHLNKATRCQGGKCRLGPAVHLSKTTAESHDAIIHGLDRKVGKLYFGREPFEPTISRWDGTPMVYAKVHPEPRNFSKSMMEELDRINGAIIGETSHSRIDMAGHPKLVVKKNYTDETAIRLYGAGLITEDQLERSMKAVPLALKLLKEGKLSHSSGFICPDDGEKLTGVVIPNHILDFEETPVDMPVDKMSVILNKESESEDSNVTEHLNQGRVMSRQNLDRLKTILDGIATFFNDLTGADVIGNESLNAASVPPNPPDFGIASGTTEGCKLTEEEFGDMEYSQIRRRFAVDFGGGTFGDLKLPHHTVNGDVVPNCVRAALSAIEGGRSGEPMDLGGTKEAALQHLNAHLDAINEAEGKPAADESTAEQPKTSKEMTDIKKNQETPPAEEPPATPPEDKDAQIAALKKEIEAKDAEITALKEELATLKGEAETAKTQKEDLTWAELKKTVISPGLVKDPADEANLRKLCKEDPVAFNAKVLAARKDDPKMQEEGSEHAHLSKDGADAIATIRELNRLTGR